MDNRDFRLLINYDYHSNLSATACYNRIKSAYPSAKLSYETVRHWYSRIRDGYEGFDDQPRSGRPQTAVTEENITLTRQLIDENPFISYTGIQQSLGVGRLAVETILTQHLGVKKIVSKFVPHELSMQQKEARMEFCKEMLAKFKNGASPTVWDIVTGDETWIRQRDPKSINQRRVWCYGDEEPTPQVRPTAWVGKQMVATFFCKGGHVATVPLEHHRTVTALWYTEVCLPKVFDFWCKRRPNDQLRHLLLHQDNAPAHTAIRTTEFLSEKSVRLLHHPPYSPDLAPADFFLFGYVKEKLRGHDFESPEAAVIAYEKLVAQIPTKIWNATFDNWFTRMTECLNNNGEYLK
jgi:histone-lysine N-methyltransferase SETMAR